MVSTKKAKQTRERENGKEKTDVCVSLVRTTKEKYRTGKCSPGELKLSWCDLVPGDFKKVVQSKYVFLNRWQVTLPPVFLEISYPQKSPRGSPGILGYDESQK